MDVFLSGELDVGRFNVATSSRDLVFTADPTGRANQVSVFDMAVGSDGGLALSYSGTFAIGGQVQPIGVDGAIAILDASTLGPNIDPNAQEIYEGDPATFELAFNDTGSILYAYNSVLSSFELKREVAPNPTNGRAYFLTTSGILIFDISTHSLLGRMSIANLEPAECPVSSQARHLRLPTSSPQLRRKLLALLIVDRNQRAGLRRRSAVGRRDRLVAVADRCGNHHVELKFARCYQPTELDGSRDASDLDGRRRR